MYRIPLAVQQLRLERTEVSSEPAKGGARDEPDLRCRGVLQIMSDMLAHSVAVQVVDAMRASRKKERQKARWFTFLVMLAAAAWRYIYLLQSRLSVRTYVGVSESTRVMHD